jgi:hypothetical protein
VVNGSRIEAWDPFARDEPATKSLEPVSIPVVHGGQRGQLLLEPFVLPHQGDFSTPESFKRASGPANWNQQQGFYIYRAHRLIQSGGWCRIRTTDEHTKLARVALRISPQLDDAFRVNVAKMRVQLPTGMRERIAEAIAPVTKIANDVYRRTSAQFDGRTKQLHGNSQRQNGIEKMRAGDFQKAVEALIRVADAAEQRVIRRVAARLSRRVKPNGSHLRVVAG